jgi:hypothetical protein
MDASQVSQLRSRLRALDASLIKDIEIALRAVDQFWHVGGKCFMRDTVAIGRRARKNELFRRDRLFPSATFLCAAALHEADLVRVDLGDDPTSRYSHSDFVTSLTTAKGKASPEESLSLYLSKSSLSVAPPPGRPGGQNWHVIPGATCVRALAAIRESQMRHALPAATGTRDDKAPEGRPMLEEIAGSQCENLRCYLTDAIEQPGLPNPVYLSAAMSSLARAYETGMAEFLFSSDDVTNRKTALELAKKVEPFAKDVLDNHRPDSPAIGSLVYLVHYASLLWDAEAPGRAAIADRSIDLIARAIVEGGAWPLGRLLLSHSESNTVNPSDAVELSPFALGATIAEFACRTFVSEGLMPESVNSRLTALEALLRSVQASRIVVFSAKLPTKMSEKSTDKGAEVPYDGWGNEHLYRNDVVQSWICASVLSFLTNFRRYVQLSLQQLTLSAGVYDVSWPREMRKWPDIEILKETDQERPDGGGPTLVEWIEERFCSTDLKKGRQRLPNPSDRNVSLVLFGPPGTSKTTIVKAMAKTLGWPLITLTPGVFLAEGIHSIDAQAARVFSDLRVLERVVILFDECDEVFRQRPRLPATVDAGAPENAEGEDARRPNGGADAGPHLDVGGSLSEAALITGAMLPRLAALHDRGKLVFALATNRITAIDRAVLRQGRFDRRCGVGPPGRASRRAILEGSLPKNYKNRKPLLDCLAALKETEGLTWSELGELSLVIQQEARSEKALKDEQLRSIVRSNYPIRSRAITGDELTEFELRMQDHCDYYRAHRQET